MARVLRYSTAVGSSKPGTEAMGGVKLQGAKEQNPAGLFLQVAEGFEMVEAVLYGFAAAEDHGGGGLDSEGVGGSVDGQPVVCGDGDFAVLLNAVVENSGVVAGDGV